MAQRECIFDLRIILNEVPDLSGPSLKLSTKPRTCEFRAFLHPDQNDARASMHECLKGSYSEPW